MSLSNIVFAISSINRNFIQLVTTTTSALSEFQATILRGKNEEFFDNLGVPSREILIGGPLLLSKGTLNLQYFTACNYTKFSIILPHIITVTLRKELKKTYHVLCFNTASQHQEQTGEVL